MRKHITVAVVNLVSYGFGIAACLILVQYIYNETSYDKFYKAHENIYRISIDNYYSGAYQNSTAFSFLPLGPELKSKYPEVSEFTVVSDRLEVVTVEDKSFFEKRVLIADVNYFKVFSLGLLSGSSLDVNPGDIFISATIAAKYFGTDDPIGKTMKVFRDFYIVKGIFEDLPSNTHIKFDILGLVAVREHNDWNVPHMYTYIRLDGDPDRFVPKLKRFSEEFSKVSDQQSEADYAFQARLQPLASIHLQSALLDELDLNGRLEDIYMLMTIAVMVQIITCFNYINLTTAINSARLKEAFVRKIHGASHRNMLTQRIVESAAINTIGFFIAFLFLITFVKWIGPFYDFPSLAVDWTSTTSYYILLILFITAFLLSGIIPTLITSVSTTWPFTKKSSGITTSGFGFSRNIAFIQFTISCVLISGALVVLKQVRFMRNGDRGFSDKGVMALEINPLSYHLNEDYFLKVKNDLEKLASIQKVSFSSCAPGERLINTSLRLSADPIESTLNCDVQVITSDYFDVYGIEMVRGRMFAESNPADVNTVVVNESLAKELSRGGEPLINREVTVDWARAPVNFKVIGVVKDYHHYSIKQEIQPMLFIPLKNTFSAFRISIKNADKANWKSNELVVQKIMKDNLTEPYSKRGIQVAFDVADVELAYNRQFGGDEQLSKFLNGLTFLAISMAGIGFFSLAYTTTRKRIREIAIRKIHGANGAHVSGLLLNYFFKVAGAGFIISVPISHYFVRGWLNSFPVRIEIDSSFVLIPVIIAGLLIGLSVSYHVLKVVLINPIHHLKEE